MQYINQAYDLLQDYIKPQGVKILSLLGLFVITTHTLSSLNSFRRTFLRIPHNLSKRYGPGSWALITGGAQGIGAAFATELAGKGFNLILIDLNDEKLSETKTLINTRFPTVQIKTISCNFLDSWKEGFYDSLVDQLQGFDISILVNNVGICHDVAPIYDVSEKGMMNTITINIVPMTILTRRLIPQMMKRSPRSAIINLSSMSGVRPAPFISTYSATKAYADFFTRAIEKDVEEKIDVLSVRPSAVATALTRNPELMHGVITPTALAISSLRKLGNTTVTYGHWSHEVGAWLNQIPAMRRRSGRIFFQKVLKASNYKY